MRKQSEQKMQVSEPRAVYKGVTMGDNLRELNETSAPVDGSLLSSANQLRNKLHKLFPCVASVHNQNMGLLTAIHDSLGNDEVASESIPDDDPAPKKTHGDHLEGILTDIDDQLSALVNWLARSADEQAVALRRISDIIGVTSELRGPVEAAS